MKVRIKYFSSSFIKERDMKKLNVKNTVFSLSAVVVAATGMMLFSDSGKATNLATEETLALSVDKLDKDTLKIALSNVVELPKSLQFSLQLDGNVYFNEDSVKWLVTNTDNSAIQKTITLSQDKKTLDVLIVSNNALKKVADSIEIAEIDVVSPNDKAAKYTLTSHTQADGTGYKYVVDSMNRQVTGPAFTLENGGQLTYNTEPRLELADSNKIVEGKIMLTIGEEFTEADKLSYVKAFDDEDGELTGIKVSGQVDTKIIGSYTLTYEVIDSLGETATLIVPVIVENKLEEQVENPQITGTVQQVNLTVGDTFDPLAGVQAIDYSGRQLTVKLSGDYIDTLVDGVLTKAGTYTIQYDAVDRHGNVAPSAITTLIVAEKPQEPEYKIPESIKDLLDLTIVNPVSGDATEQNPLILTVTEQATKDSLSQMINEFKDYTVKVTRLNTRTTISYSVELTTSQEHHYLVFNVESTQTEVVDYLDSLTQSSGEETPDNEAGGTTPDNEAGEETPDNEAGEETPDNEAGGTTPDNEAGGTTPDNEAGETTPDNEAGGTTPDNEAGGTTPDNEAGGTTPDNEAGETTPDNEAGETNKDQTQSSNPQTGMNMKVPLILCGVMTTIAGVWVAFKNKLKKQ